MKRRLFLIIFVLYSGLTISRLTMNIKFKIALRYIFPKRKLNLISIITILSIIGISIGVAALIVVMSIFNGFKTISESIILDVDPAVRITKKASSYFVPDTTLIKQIEQLSDVRQVVPILQTKAVIVNNSNIEVVELISNSKDLLNKDNFVLEFNCSDSNNVIIGVALSNRLKINIFDTVQIISMTSLKNSFHSMRLPSGINIAVSGIIQTNVKYYDLTNCYTDYNIVRKITGNISDGAVTQIDIFPSKNTEKTSAELAATIKKILPEEYKMQTWIDLNKDLYSIMKMERVAVFCVISLILLIATFNVFASLTMTVMEKKKEIALLKALGSENFIITNIYIIEGILIGSIGTIIGLFLGVGFVLGHTNFNWIELASNVSIVSTLPMELNQFEVIIVCIFSLVLSVVAAYFPAIAATKKLNVIRLCNE